MFILGVCGYTSYLGKPFHLSWTNSRTSITSCMPSVLSEIYAFQPAWDKSMKNLSYLSELFKPLESAQGVRYLRRGAVLPVPIRSELPHELALTSLHIGCSNVLSCG